VGRCGVPNKAARLLDWGRVPGAETKRNTSVLLYKIGALSMKPTHVPSAPLSFVNRKIGNYPIFPLYLFPIKGLETPFK